MSGGGGGGRMLMDVLSAIKFNGWFGVGCIWIVSF